jgi:hypothetical protein
MRSKGRVYGIILAVLALCLVAVGVVAAVSDSNPTGVSDSALQLPAGQAPSTATMSMTITTGGQYQVTGTAQVDFKASEAQFMLHVPLAFSTTSITGVFANGTLYLTSPALQSVTPRPWIAVPTSASSFDFGAAALALGDYSPDSYWFTQHGFTGPKVTTQGPFTYYAFTLAKSIPLPSVLGGGTTSPLASIVATVTTASQGQVAGLNLVLSTAKSTKLSAGIQVTSYNHPVTITVPSANQIMATPGGSTPSASGIISQLIPGVSIPSLGSVTSN